MGSIHFAAGTFVAAISEVVGYKSGLALSREEILRHLKASQYLQTVVEAEAPVRIRADVFERIVLELLYTLGRVESQQPRLPLISVFLKYKNHPAEGAVALEVMEMFVSFLNDATRRFDGKRTDIDPTPFLDAVLEKHGPLGAEIGVELCESTNAVIEESPWSQLRSIQWKDTRERSRLYSSLRFRSPPPTIHNKLRT